MRLQVKETRLKAASAWARRAVTQTPMGKEMPRPCKTGRTTHAVAARLSRQMLAQSRLYIKNGPLDNRRRVGAFRNRV